MASDPSVMQIAASVLQSLPSTTTLNLGEIPGGNAVLSWTDATGFLALQSATNVAGPYRDIAGAISPYTNAIATGQTYFRLKY